VDVTIRPLVASDERGWRALWAGYLSFYATDLPETTTAATFARLTSSARQDMQGLVAVSGRQPVGLVHYVFHRTTWSPADTCYLQDLYADPAARGAGIGRRLIEAVYAASDRAGAASVYWLTQEFNHTARALYDRVAAKTPFIVYGRGAI
jgi:GNAT superfamily N-acetyltransferase